MKLFAYGLIGIGFLAGSLVSVQTTGNSVPWSLYIPSLILAMAGVVMARVGGARTARKEGATVGDLNVLTGSIGRIVGALNALKAEQAGVPVREWHSRIDRLFRSDLEQFAGGRHAITQHHGLQAYAGVMNEFAAGERYLNRVWSASVDGYADEVLEYLDRAREQFLLTQAALEACAGDSADSKGT